MNNGLAEMPRISEVDVLSPALQQALRKVGAFFVREGLTTAFAVQVGHRHFDVLPHEALLEEVDQAAPALKTHVVPRGEVLEGQASTWQFAAGNVPVTTIWSTHPCLRDLDVTSAGFQALLAKIGAFFLAEGLDRLSVVRLRCAFIPAGPGLVLDETTDGTARTQTTVPAPRVDGDDQLASTWYFELTGEPRMMVKCNDNGASGAGGEHIG